MAARFGLQVANQGSVFTYRWPGFGNSISDVTFASERDAGLIRGWRVSEELTCSDHQYIFFELTNPEEVRPAAWHVTDRDPYQGALYRALCWVRISGWCSLTDCFKWWYLSA